MDAGDVHTCAANAAAAATARGMSSRSGTDEQAAVIGPLHKSGMSEERARVDVVRREAVVAYMPPSAPVLDRDGPAAPYRALASDTPAPACLAAEDTCLSPLTPPLPCEASVTGLCPPTASFAPLVPGSMRRREQRCRLQQRHGVRPAARSCMPILAHGRVGLRSCCHWQSAARRHLGSQPCCTLPTSSSGPAWNRGRALDDACMSGQPPQA